MTHDAPPGDPFNLQRFVEAQQPNYDNAVRELRAGCKRSHWIWYIFPQMKGLGSSRNADRYGITSLAEAEAYLAHPILGHRLKEVTGLVLHHRESSLQQIFGTPDDLKFRSSMTLFARAAGGESIFREALLAFCAGEEDVRTATLLAPPRS